MKYIFGPVISRRFGFSLGINLSPDVKCCNFDCLYCELKKAKPVESIKNQPKVDDIIDELKLALNSHKVIDVITITANGEPTLYEDLEELIQSINLIKSDRKTLILSNGSLIYKESVQNALLYFDIVKLSLDCISKRCFKILDRAKNLNIDEIIDSMILFKQRFKGELIIEILFVKWVNDNIEEIELLNQTLLKINPDRIDLNSIDRPPAYDNIQGLSYDELFEISNLFSKELNISIATRKELVNRGKFTKEEIIETIKNRPFSESDIKNLFDDDSIELFYSIKSLFKEKNIAGVKFFYLE